MIRNLKYLFAPAIACVLFAQCSPKVSEETVEEQVEETMPDPQEDPEGLSPCRKFSDNRNGEELLEEYVVYRDFVKINDFQGAFERWKRVYENAPAADGKRWTVFSDGIRIYEFFLAKTEDSLKRAEYIDRIFELYDGIARCYPEQKTYIKARKAFDYYYNYPWRKTDLQKFQMFKESIDEMGMNTPAFVINPFTALLVNLYLADEISMEEARTYAYEVRDIIDHNLRETDDPKSWTIVKNFAPLSLERLEGVKGFYDCQYYKDKYYDRLSAAMGDCEEMIAIYSKLRHGDCPENDTAVIATYNALKQNDCISQQPSVTTHAGKAYECLQNGDYRCAIREFEKAAAEAETNEKKAQYLLLAAKIYYAHLKNFPRARSLALQAAKVKPNWGEPYILIGKLYASSGPLCGPGTGFESQVVVWVAIDMWEQAKRVDASVRSEANRLIDSYTQYMPSVEDIFSRPIEEGDTYKVGCWIQRETIVRAAPR